MAQTVAAGSFAPGEPGGAVEPDVPDEPEATSIPSDPPIGRATRRRRLPALAVVAIVLSGTLLLAGATIGTAIVTADRWTKVDVPEHPETFHTEEYSTGAYIVTDTGANPCYVGQPWYECRNKYVDEYNRECAERTLTPESVTVCNDYGSMIDDMEAKDEYGAEVATLGDYGYLRSTPETDTRRVSNDDYRPAVTHEAICYFAFIGECR